jgi:hypothetical protein
LGPLFTALLFSRSIPFPKAFLFSKSNHLFQIIPLFQTNSSWTLLLDKDVFGKVCFWKRMLSKKNNFGKECI